MTDRDALDLFGFLGQLNRRDPLAYDRLSDEAKKAAHPLVIMRWLTGTSDQAQIVRLNEFANKYVFALGTDKALLFKLLAAACTGKTSRTNWIKGPGSKSARLAIQAVAAKYECSIREAEEYLQFLSAEDVVLCAEEVGWDKDSLKKLTSELGKDDDIGPGRSAKSRSKSKK